MENGIEPKGISFSRSIDASKHGEKTTYRMIIQASDEDKISFYWEGETSLFNRGVYGSNASYSYLLSKFWRYLGAG